MENKNVLRLACGVCATMLLLTSCVSDTVDTTYSDSDDAVIEQTEYPSEQTQAPVQTSSPITQAPETEDMSLKKTGTPTIKRSKNISPDTVLIYGTAPIYSTVTLTYENGESYSTKIYDKYFYMSAKTDTYNEQKIYITARAEGCRTSDRVSVNIKRKESISTDVFIGTDSRLYFNHTIPYHQGEVRVQENMLRYSVGVLKQRLQKVRELTGKDTKFIYLLCPNPVTVYYDRQFDELSDKQNKTPTTQLVEALSEEDGFIIPDLRAIFAEHRDEEIFYRTDTHWTELGAYYAYAEMMKEVQKDFPSAPLHALDEFDVSSAECKGGDMGPMVGINSIRETASFFTARFEQTGDYYTAKKDAGYKIAGIPVATSYPLSSTADVEGAPTAYFLGDSYGAYFLPFAGMGFSYLSVNEGVLWNYTIDYEKIAEEKPDYIIFCYTERNVNQELSIILSE